MFEPLETFREGADLTHSRSSSTGVLSGNGLRAWRHSSTGVRLVRFHAPGPLVSLSIFVATEAVSDAGHPHTLEHIVFLGSRAHPKRGFLDTLACRVLGEGTNAYTANEYTCYTATTAGVEGFVSLLPCYVDHVFRPTRTADAAAFASEVYHARADGREAGVVMSEMAAREHSEADILDREVRRALLGGTPLAYEAGGMCGAIRGLSAAEIDAYHKRFYCGENVTIVVGGSAAIDDDVFLDALGPLLEGYAKDEEFKRGSSAWASVLDLKPLVGVERRTVGFPCADASMGSVTLGWRACGKVEGYRLLALEVLLEWLCAYESSPLQQKFVMIEAPLASDVDQMLETFLDVSLVCLTLEGVEHIESAEDEDDGSEGEHEADGEKNGEVGEVSAGDENEEAEEDGKESFLLSGQAGKMLMEFLETVVKSKTLPAGLHSIHAAIRRHREDFLAELETNAHEVVPNALVEELIYGDRPSFSVGTHLRDNFDMLSRLEQEGEEYWLSLIATQFLDSPRVEICMVPDPAMAKKLADDAQTECNTRLKSASAEARQAMQDHTDELVASLSPGDFPDSCLPTQPTAEFIPRLPYKVALSSQDGPFPSQLVTVDSGLVHTTLVFSTRSLSFEQRLCLPLLQDLFLSMDIVLDDGRKIPYTESSRAIDEATVGTGDSGVLLYGLAGMNCDSIGVHFAATPENFGEATELVLRAIFNGQPSSARLSSVAKNLESDVTESLRDTHTVQVAAGAVIPFLSPGICDEKNMGNRELISLFGRAPFLEFIADEYSSEKGRQRVRGKILKLFSSTLVAIREQSPECMFLQIGARDPEASMKTFTAHWSDHCWMPASDSDPGDAVMTPKDSGLLAIGKEPPLSLASLVGENKEVSVVLGVPGSETCYLDVRVDCAISRDHKDFAPMCVLTEMLSRTEGPLYTAVRGAGSAYGVSFYYTHWRSKIVVSINEASLPAEAWSAVCVELQEFGAKLLNGAEDSSLLSELHTAKSTLLYGELEEKSTPAKIIDCALSACIQDLPAGEMIDRTEEERIEAVNFADLTRVYDQHVGCLFNKSARIATMACSPSTIEGYVSSLAACAVPLHFKIMEIDDCMLKPVKQFVTKLGK